MGAADTFQWPQQIMHIDAFDCADSAIDRGLQRLAGAVLIQALDDLSRGPRKAREQAREWIFDGSVGDFNFNLCCSLLGREPEDVRWRLRRYHIFAPADREPRTHSASLGGAPINYLPD